MGISIIESVRWVSWERRHPQSFQRWQPAGARCVGKGELFIIFGHFQQFWLAEVMFIFLFSISVFHSPGVLCVEQLLADWHRDTMDTYPNRVNKGNWHNEVSEYPRRPSATTAANIDCHCHWSDVSQSIVILIIHNSCHNCLPRCHFRCHVNNISLTTNSHQNNSLKCPGFATSKYEKLHCLGNLIISQPSPKYPW